MIVTFKDLPPALSNKAGWPWTEAEEPLSETMLDGSKYPRISIVTPSYNQGQFIEETIRSVLLQGYPNLEYTIVDGGSTDNTVEIIKKYEQFLTYWVSEPDEGQTDAINKGFELSTGDIMGWLNSDDLLEASALYHLSKAYKPGMHWWVGKAFQIFDEDNYRKKEKDTKLIPISRNNLLYARKILPQVSTYWNRELWNKSGAYLSHYDLAMDYELWLRFSLVSSAIPINHYLGILRTHEKAKTGTLNGMQAYVAECDVIRKKEFENNIFNYLFIKCKILFFTRYYLSKQYNWRSWIGKRPIPYI